MGFIVCVYACLTAYMCALEDFYFFFFYYIVILF